MNVNVQVRVPQREVTLAKALLSAAKKEGRLLYRLSPYGERLGRRDPSVFLTRNSLSNSIPQHI